MVFFGMNRYRFDYRFKTRQNATICESANFV